MWYAAAVKWGLKLFGKAKKVKWMQWVAIGSITLATLAVNRSCTAVQQKVEAKRRQAVLEAKLADKWIEAEKWKASLENKEVENANLKRQLQIHKTRRFQLERRLPDGTVEITTSEYTDSKTETAEGRVEKTHTPVPPTLPPIKDDCPKRVRCWVWGLLGIVLGAVAGVAL